jgi:D-arginine dehydrogenase
VASRADVVILGAGFAGAATAYHLAKRGVRDVVVLEREPAPGLHASGRNASLVFLLMEHADEAQLAIEGAEFYASPPEDFSSRPLLRRAGSLLVASDAGIGDIVAAARDAESLGVEVRRLSPQEAAERVPALHDAAIAGALENPADGVVDVRALLEGYLGAARRAGATIRCNERVTAIAAPRGEVTEVTTGTDRIETRIVVDAAGAWAGEIGRLAGAAPVGIAPFRRHIFLGRPAVGIDPGGPFVWHSNVDVYFRPEGEGLLLSPCDQTPHAAADPEVDGDSETWLREKLGRAFPSLAGIETTGVRACLRTFAPDGRFVIGRDPRVEGFVWVAALGGHGMSTSYGVGRLAAAAVIGERSPELERFSPARFPSAEDVSAR